MTQIKGNLCSFTGIKELEEVRKFCRGSKVREDCGNSSPTIQREIDLAGATYKKEKKSEEAENRQQNPGSFGGKKDEVSPTKVIKETVVWETYTIRLQYLVFMI